MESKANLLRYLHAIGRRRGLVIGTTLIIVVLAAIVTLLWPKTFESEATIKLATIGRITVVDAMTGFILESGRITKTVSGRVERALVYQPEEVRELLVSSTILTPIIEEFFSKDDEMSLDKFREEMLDAHIVTEKISVKDIRAAPYLHIKVKADSAERSQKMAWAIAKRFLNHTGKRFNAQKELIFREYNTTNVNIEEEIVERGKRMAQLEKEIAELKSRISQLPKESLSTAGLSSASLLTSTLENYNSMLLAEKDSVLNLRESLNNIRITRDRRLADSENFEVISEPQLPLEPASPNILLNMLIALVGGLVFSVLLALFKEEVN